MSANPTRGHTPSIAGILTDVEAEVIAGARRRLEVIDSELVGMLRVTIATDPGGRATIAGSGQAVAQHVRDRVEERAALAVARRLRELADVLDPPPDPPLEPLGPTA